MRVEEHIGKTLERPALDARMMRMQRRVKNFIERLNDVQELKQTVDKFHTLRWIPVDGKPVTVMLDGQKYETVKLEFHGIGERTLLIYTLEKDGSKDKEKVVAFSERDAERLQILN